MDTAVELRPGRPQDDAAVLAALALRDLHDTGDAHFSGGFVADAWGVPSFEPHRDSVIAQTHERELAGYAARLGEGDIGFVVPGFESMGVGSRLLAWLHSRAGVGPAAEHRQRIAAANARAAALLSAAGYRRVRGYLRLELALSDVVEPQSPPRGIALSPPDIASEAHELHALDDVSFSENADYTPETFESFVAAHLMPGDVAPQLSTVARREGALVGMVICRRRPGEVGYIDLLAVAPGARRQGLGRTLLTCALSAFARAGLGTAQLEVASDNPVALSLYRQLGMRERHRADVYERPAP